MGMFDTINDVFNKSMDDPMFNMGLALMSQWKTPYGQPASLSNALQHYQGWQQNQYLNKMNAMKMDEMKRQQEKAKAYGKWVEDNVKPASQVPYQADNAFDENLGNLYENKGATFAGEPIDPGLAGILKHLDPEDAFKLYTAKKGLASDTSTAQMKNWQYAQSLSPEDQKMFWERMGGGSGQPAAIQEFERYKALSPEDRALWAEARRAPTYLDQGGYRVQAGPGGVLGPPIPKTLPPQDLPSVRGQQAAASAAGTAAVDLQTKGPIAASVDQAKADVDLTVKKPSAKARVLGQEAKYKNLEATVDKAIKNVSTWNTGLPAQALSKIGGTSAKDLASTLDTIKANLGFDELAQMRQESPTGGALGQVAVQEIQYLQAVVASLEQAQSKEQLVENLGKVKQAKKESNERVKAAYEATYAESAPSTERPRSIEKVDKKVLMKQYTDAMAQTKNPETRKRLTDKAKEMGLIK